MTKNRKSAQIWIASRGCGKTKLTMTQFISALDIPYEEKLAWTKLIWGESEMEDE